MLRRIVNRVRNALANAPALKRRDNQLRQKLNALERRSRRSDEVLRMQAGVCRVTLRPRGGDDG